ncbi:PrsW family intramembrane metalloprotease [Euzebya tangerina]|uniref:PrsW family intramembrane metalloprotease n=1 Tax=Euzebya tangerina TaxID=591198 RepID=UPI0013C358CE|nr:PrsW family intramembrane metalloprotease [Euzebya tangerina]
MSVFLIAFLGAVLPCLAWLRFFYTRDKYEPEPPALIAKLFVIGALPVGFLAGILNTIALLFLSGGRLDGPAAVAQFTTLAVVVAPITEETLKYLGAGLGTRRSRAFDEPMDGIIYGTTVGLGFAAAETIDYLIQAYQGFGPLGTPIGFCDPGAGCLLVVAFLRGIGSALLHATAGGIAGYGLSRRRIDGRGRAAALLWIAIAMGVHALWNGVAFISLVVPVAIYAVLVRRALRRSPFVARGVRPLRSPHPPT